MGRIFAFSLGLWLAATSLFAQDAEAIEDVISTQLQAFNDRDVTEAWRYASPTIKQMFGSAQNFGVMVERGYPMVWDNASVRFLELMDINGRQVQKVLVQDAGGTIHTLLYTMVQVGADWQINGVQLLPGADLGA